MTRFSYFIFIVVLSVGVVPHTGSVAFAQKNNIDTLIKKFDHFRKKNYQEKVYVHLDRPSYLTGETMWLKIYLTDGSIHKPSGVSKVVYVEFMDVNNQSVLQTKIKVSNGTGAGSLFIPATLNSGNYMIRAYTNWMKNFNAEFFFHKPVSIVNTFKSMDPETTAAATVTLYDAQFFPEGGNLVAGIKSKVAFRVADSKGNGIDFKGTLVDQQNDTVVSFHPLRFGIGHFSFTPKTGYQYRIILRDRFGKTKTTNLPSVLPSGYTMHVSDSSGNQLQVKVNAILTDATIIPGVYLFVHSRNVVASATFQMLNQGSATFRINTADLAEGISHITVFDASMKPVCERLYFKYPENNISLSIRPNQTQYGLRRPVKIDLTSMVKQEAKESNLSISVSRIDSLPTVPGNIINYFWLTSDLKGTVESPEFYFAQTSEAKEAVDNLMLTHGWRRFAWNDVLTNKKSNIRFIPEWRGHIIQGSVTNVDGSPAPGVMTYLSSPGKIIQLYPSRSNEKGEVQFETQNFYGSSKIVALTNYTRDSTYKITIPSPFSDQFASRPIPAFTLTPSHESMLLSRSISMQVQDIYFAAFEKTKPASIDSSAFYGKADETYLLDAYTRFPVMEEVMREYVPGVLVRKRKDGFHFIVVDHIRKGVFDETPLVLLDGVPIFDEDEIMDFDPLKVKKLEIMTRRWYLGPLTFAGIVSYTTYHGDLGEFKINPKSVTLNYEGLQLQREFYSPKYENQKQRESRLPDQRHVVYWNPTVLTQSDGKAQVEFYTSDIPGEYKIVVEGMTEDGAVGTSTTTFTVREFNN